MHACSTLLERSLNDASSIGFMSYQEPFVAAHFAGFARTKKDFFQFPTIPYYSIEIWTTTPTCRERANIVDGIAAMKPPSVAYRSRCLHATWSLRFFRNLRGMLDTLPAISDQAFSFGRHLGKLAAAACYHYMLWRVCAGKCSKTLYAPPPVLLWLFLSCRLGRICSQSTWATIGPSSNQRTDMNNRQVECHSGGTLYDTSIKSKYHILKLTVS